MNKLYEFDKVESEILKFWNDNNYFNHLNKDSDNKYSLIMPPPNRTGKLHMGHALNNTLQDILVRRKRMEGYDIMWIPGTDHAGIATQNMVAKKLPNYRSLSREDFLKEIWKWTDEHGDIIINQLKMLGISCNWDKMRFTLDDDYITLVKKTFVELYKRNLIYRGDYITNWCCKCQTVISDEEVNTDKKDGYMYYIKYFLENSEEFIVIATTRPETLFGDSAVGCSTSDERYKQYTNKKCVVPIVNRIVPIIFDHTISKDFGTGAMKITPAHDKADFVLGMRHKLESINVIDKFGKILPEFNLTGNITNLRPQVVKMLEELNLLVKKDPYVCTEKSCYRCNGEIHNIVSLQWYIKMESMAEKIKDVNCNFYPEFQKNTYTTWLNNITDWCISRQIIWGHQIPVSYCQDCTHVNVSDSDITKCDVCSSANLKKETDVLDTWFSSWLWAFGVFNGKDNSENYKKYFPLDVVVSGSDILFFWITKMIMASVELQNVVPFGDILLHGLIRDKDGIKMSKSIGNVIDPLDVIKQYGTDSLRFGLLFISSTDKDVKLDIKIIQNGKALTTKLWNAARFIIMKSSNVDANNNIVNEYDTIFTSELNSVIDKVNVLMTTYEFNGYSRCVYSFFWDNFCSTYLEKTKNDLSASTFKTLYESYITILKLFHPIMPFITEKIYQELKSVSNIKYEFKQSIMIDSIQKN